MAKINHYRDYGNSYRYPRNTVIWKRVDGRYIVAGLQSREAAEEIRKGLVEVIRDYGKVTVSDLYDLVGEADCQYTHNNIGWSAMAGLQWRAAISWDEHKGWCIDLPETNWDSSHHIEVMPVIKQTPTSVNITINTETIDDFDNVFAKVSQYANTVTDRNIYISII